jgi:choline dehydrogenase-like flavoprotein
VTHSGATVIVVGSGAGGAVTALTLAEAGYDVLVLEEGPRVDRSEYGSAPTVGMRRLFRRSGMTPIVGRVPIAYVEGCCLGGSTEVNSGFWHRAAPEILLRWKAQFDLAEAGEQDLDPHFLWAEQLLGVGLSQRPWPPSTRVLADGAEKMGWSYLEVPRTAPGCRQTNTCAQGCPTGSKQGMSVGVLPRAQALGARVLTDCRVDLLLRNGGRVEGVIARLRGADGTERLVRIAAKHVFVCAGATETPSLLRRSGLKFHVGNTLRIHPYLKVVARFAEAVDADRSVMPLLQVKEFWPEIAIGGAYFTSGHLAAMLSDHGNPEHDMAAHRRMAAYYIGVKGSGAGSVRPSWADSNATTVRYDLSEHDRRNLSVGLARVSTLLLAAGAESIVPTAYGIPAIQTPLEAIRWLDTMLPASSLSLTTVHAFSSCPIGERRDRCAADSYGGVHGCSGLHINDASMLPDSPGVNPQGTIMAMARRNALHFVAQTR